MDDFNRIKSEIKSNSTLKDQVRTSARRGFLGSLRSIISAFVEDVFSFFRLRRTGQEVVRTTNQLIDWAIRKWG